MGKREMNAREIHALELIAGLDCQLQRGSTTLQERLRDAGVWQKYRTAMAMLERTLDALYRTIPDKTMRHMVRLLEVGQIVIRPKPMVDARDVQIVQAEDLKILINETIKGNCALCMERGGKVRSCPIRRALAEIAPTEALPEDGSCAYQHVAQGNDYGQYI